MTKPKWHILVRNHRPRMCDGVQITNENGYYSIYRYIDDWDEDGDSIYEVEEYLNRIPEHELKTVIGASSDSDVFRWVKAHLIKDRSNSLDAIIAFLDTRNIDYSYDHMYV